MADDAFLSPLPPRNGYARALRRLIELRHHACGAPIGEPIYVDPGTLLIMYEELRHMLADQAPHDATRAAKSLRYMGVPIIELARPRASRKIEAEVPGTFWLPRRRI